MASSRLGLVAAIACFFSSPAAADPGDVRVVVDNVGGYLNELDGLGETVEDPAHYRRCFARDSLRETTVTAEVNVRRNGKSGSVLFVGSPPQRVKTCFKRVIRRFRFPRGAHPRSVRFTVTAEPERAVRALAVVGDDEEPLGLGLADASVDKAPAPPTNTTPPTVTVVEGHVLSGPDVVEGALVKIRSAYVAGFKRCYRESPAGKAEWKGDVDITFTIDMTGRARGDSLSGGDEALAACLATRSDGWRFPIPSEPVTMQVRLHFDPK